jgi:hypothetical protein
MGRASHHTYERWWAEVCRFLEAQLIQRRQPASSYLDYLATRTVAQGVPLTVELAALLTGCHEELQTARTATLLWWAGCYMGLANDLSSYEREVAEGTVSTANARGVLADISVSSGIGFDERLGEILVRRDVEMAWQHFNHALGPQSGWTATDWIIARLARLLHNGYAQ